MGLYQWMNMTQFTFHLTQFQVFPMESSSIDQLASSALATMFHQPRLLRTLAQMLLLLVLMVMLLMSLQHPLPEVIKVEMLGPQHGSQPRSRAEDLDRKKNHDMNSHEFTSKLCI